MLKITFIVVDRTRAAFLREGESFYLDRIRPFAQTNWVIVKPEKATKGRPADEIIALEGQAIIRKFPPQDHIIALDREGHAYSSTELASRIASLSTLHNRMTFVIGGPLGLSLAVRSSAQETLSLSKLTLTHEMARLLLLEQIYRAFTILQGTGYHK